MTQIRLDTPTDAETFRADLTELLSAADREGIPIERAWECRGDDDGWEVEVVPLAQEQQPE